MGVIFDYVLPVLALLGAYSFFKAVCGWGTQTYLSFKRAYRVKYCNIRWHVTHDNKTIVTKNWGVEPFRTTTHVYDGIVPTIARIVNGSIQTYAPKYSFGSPGTLQRRTVATNQSFYFLKLHYPLRPTPFYRRSIGREATQYSVNFTYVWDVSLFELPPIKTHEWIRFNHDKVRHRKMIQEICLPYGYRAKVDANGNPVVRVGIRSIKIHEVRLGDTDTYVCEKIEEETLEADDLYSPDVFEGKYSAAPKGFLKEEPAQELVEIIGEDNQRYRAYVLKMVFNLPKIRVKYLDDTCISTGKQVLIQWEWEKVALDH